MVGEISGPLWSVEAYLEFERHNGARHEFYDGYVYAMAGATQAHSEIAVTVVST